MILVAELEHIARARLDDAKVLLTAGRFDGATYLCGYAVEVALKARICRVLNWSEFPALAASFRRIAASRHTSWTFCCACRVRRCKSSRITSPSGTPWPYGKPSHATMPLAQRNNPM